MEEQSQMESLVKPLGQIFKNKRVFITGHTGFIGSWLSLWLCNLGAKLKGFSNDILTEPSHFQSINIEMESDFGDILNIKQFQKALHTFQPEIVFHLAAEPIVSKSYDNPLSTYQTNVIGTLNLFETCKNIESVKAIVNVTTDKVYQNNEAGKPFRESDKFGGNDIYSSSKACSEILSASYSKSFLQEKGILLSTVRSGNVIGGGDWGEARLVPDIVRSMIGENPLQVRNIKAIRPWVYILDCVKGILLLGEKLLKGEKSFCGAWNFGGDSDSSLCVEDIIKRFQKEWGDFEYKLVPGFKENEILRLDSSKAKCMLGWQPTMDFSQMIYETVSWYKDFYENKQIRSSRQLNKYFELQNPKISRD